MNQEKLLEEEGKHLLRSTVGHACEKVFQNLERELSHEKRSKQVLEDLEKGWYCDASAKKAALYEQLYKAAKRFFIEEIGRNRETGSLWGPKRALGTVSLEERLKQKEERGEI